MPLEGRVADRAAGEPRPVVHQPPEVLDPERILADQPALEVLDHRDRRRVRADAVGLADPVDVLVGDHLDEDVVAVAEIHAVRVNVDDLHGTSSSKRTAPGARGLPALGSAPREPFARAPRQLYRIRGVLQGAC